MISAAFPITPECSRDEIATFHVYENGLELWQGEKERPYLFVLDAAASEICGVLLSRLLEVASGDELNVSVRLTDYLRWKRALLS